MRYICSPVSKSAMDRLNVGMEFENDLLEIKIDDKLYKKICGSGFFYEVNGCLNKHIDDYEDECITNFFELIRLKEINCKYKIEGFFFLEMERLIVNAIKNNTGVFFFF